MQGYFITGTDTEVGKTIFAGELLQQLGNQGYKTAGLKPVASGCVETSQGLLNIDALYLQKRSNTQFPYAWVNPFAFKEAIAPNIAAQMAGATLTVANIMQACQPILTSHIDWLVIEGAGGWQVPLNNVETMADLAKAFGFPIILVVKLRLGCINQAILTYQNILNMKLEMFGWVANEGNIKEMGTIVDYTLIKNENIKTIQRYLPVPFLGVIPYDKEKYTIDCSIERNKDFHKGKNLS